MSHIIQSIIGGIKQLGEGGFLMIPILFSSIFTHMIILERLYNLRRSKLMPSRFIARIYKVLEKGNPEMALSLCESRPGPLTNILKAGIANRNLKENDLRAVIDIVAKPEKTKLQKYLNTLKFLGGVSVLMGLLGTVLGMFISFSVVFKAESPEASMTVAKGVSISLLTTVAGLAVALPAMIGYAYFMYKTDSMINDMTRHSLSLVRFITTGSSRLVEQEAERDNE